MKKAFLDCGTHFGKGLRSIIHLENIDNTWDIFCWEANPYTYEVFKKNKKYDYYNLTSYNAAVSDQYGTVKLNVQTINTNEKTGDGSSIVQKEEWLCKAGKFEEIIDISSIDFSDWVSKNCEQYDYVLVKFDIEGSEYPVLEKMIKDQSLKFIDKIYIEWHSRMFPDPLRYKNLEKTILEKIKEHNIEVINWH